MAKKAEEAGQEAYSPPEEVETGAHTADLSGRKASLVAARAHLSQFVQRFDCHKAVLAAGLGLEESDVTSKRTHNFGLPIRTIDLHDLMRMAHWWTRLVDMPQGHTVEGQLN